MRKIKESEGRECPYCGSTESQWKIGTNDSQTQRFLCKNCRKSYTPSPREHRYDEKTRKEAMRMLVSGISGRRIGLLLGMCKNNAYNWAKETAKKGPEGCG
jgi:transposase-like protein